MLANQMKIRQRVAPLLGIILVTGCSPAPFQLTAGVVAGIVGEQVTGGVFGKVVFDPVWEFFIGKPGEDDLKSLKSDFVREATKTIVESIISSAQAADATFMCDRGEEIGRCQQRVSEIATLGFNSYAPKFVTAWQGCRDSVALSPSTGALDYTDQVRLISKCIGDKGFEREIVAIMKHVQRRS